MPRTVKDPSELARLRMSLYWTQRQMVDKIYESGAQYPDGKRVVNQFDIAAAENGRLVIWSKATAIAQGLNYGYKENRFTAEDILRLISEEGQKRAEKKRESPDRLKEDKALDQFALAV
jgi:hypothetical protein